MARILKGLMLMFVLTAMFTGVANAETRKTASNTSSVYSWAGVKVVSISVKGYYYTNGRKITRYSGTTPSVRKCNGCFLYTIDAASSSWIAQGDTEGVAHASAEVKVGIPTPWGTVAWDQYTLDVEAIARR